MFYGIFNLNLIAIQKTGWKMEFEVLSCVEAFKKFQLIKDTVDPYLRINWP